MRNSVITPIAAGVLLAFAGAAHAVTKSDSFTVSATVAKNCVIDAPDLNLGSFDGTNDLIASSTISVKCTNNTTYDVNLSTGSSGVYTNRTLLFGTGVLNYNLYTTNSHATVWGDGTTGGSGRPATATGAGMSTNQTLTVYGQLLAAANTAPVDAGTYTDTIIATIVY